jgi:hypothetical protein
LGNALLWGVWGTARELFYGALVRVILRLLKEIYSFNLNKIKYLEIH